MNTIFQLSKRSASEVAVVREVDEPLARARLLLTSEVREQIEAVDVHLELLARLPSWPFLKFLDDVGLARGRQEGGQPVVVLDDLVEDGAHPGILPGQRTISGARNAPSPVRVLLAAEGSRPRVGPGVPVAAPLSVEYMTIVSSAIPNLSSKIEQLADVPVVVDHRVVVRRPPAAGLARRLRAFVWVRKCICVVFTPAEERLAACCAAAGDVVGARPPTNSSSARLHPLPRQRARVLDPLLADAAPARGGPRGRPCSSPCIRGHHAARSARGTSREAVLASGSPDPPGPPRRSGGTGSRRTRRSRAGSGGTRCGRRGGSSRIGRVA